MPWPDVEAMVAPPAGWKPDPLKKSSRHEHQVWVSPSGSTAYGVIHFRTPIPVSAEFVLPFFLAEMRRKQGEAILLNKESDAQLPGVRFECEGGPYRLNVNLLTSGREGWAIYTGTLRDLPIESNELSMATAAREQTHVGIPAELNRSR